MRFIYAFFFSFIVLLGGAGRGGAESSLKIAVNSEWYPLTYADGGKAAGILVDLARQVIERRAGVRIDFSTFPWARAQAEVKAARMDALITFPSDERLLYATATRNALFVTHNKPAVRRNSPAHQAVAAAGPATLPTGFKYCIDRANAAIGQLYAKSGIVPMEGNDVAHCLLLLEAGRADLMIHSEPTLLANMRRLPDGGRELVVPPIAYTSVPLNLLVRLTLPAHAAIVRKVDAVIDALNREGEYQALIDSAFAESRPVPGS